MEGMIMCLIVKKRKLPFKDGKRICYKILYKHDKRNIVRTVFQNFRYNIGWNKARGKLNKGNKISGGAIHVFTSKQEAKKCVWAEDTIVKVICYEKDLIATGGDLDACFKKLLYI